jgi:hypothetical protein
MATDLPGIFQAFKEPDQDQSNTKRMESDKDEKYLKQIQ